MTNTFIGIDLAWNTQAMHSGGRFCGGGSRTDAALPAAMWRSGRGAFEVYPHPAMVRLFGLNRIIKYKKGLVEEKRAGLRALVAHLRRLPGLKVSAQLEVLLGRDVESLRRTPDRKGGVTVKGVAAE